MLRLHQHEPHDRAGNVAAATLERLIADLIVEIRERLGLHVRAQRDPGGRIVSYGYHWHQPDAHGECPYFTVYGYATPLEALIAGLVEGLTVGLTVVAREDEPVHPDFLTRCERQG